MRQGRAAALKTGGGRLKITDGFFRRPLELFGRLRQQFARIHNIVRVEMGFHRAHQRQFGLGAHPRQPVFLMVPMPCSAAMVPLSCKTFS